MDYITIADIDGKGYYQLNKNLFNNQYYQKKIKKIKTIKNERIEVTVIKDNLSDTSKILYSILCDQLKRSLENGWWDEFKRVYVKFSLEKLANILNKSRDTIITCKKELEENGLLEIKDTGLGKADIFYIGKVKARPIKDIEFELLNQIDLSEVSSNKPVDILDWSKTSEKVVEKFDSKPVENVDSIKLINKTISTSSSEERSNIYIFLNNFKLQPATKKFIRKNIHDLTEEAFTKIYNKVKKELEVGKIRNFEAVLYKALKDEWAFSITLKEKIPSFNDYREKAKNICNYWLDSPYSIKEKIVNFINDTKDCPHEIIEEYKNKMIEYLKKEGDLFE